jgi:DNA-binding transcriptional ArsR family regulator
MSLSIGSVVKFREDASLSDGRRRPMTGEVDLAAIGALLSDRTRATILLTLLNGGMTSASTLADRARVSRPLASAHLRKLTEGGLVIVEPHGRHRYYRLSSQSVADALEVLILLSPPAITNSLRSAREAMALRQGRLCYDHLAGRLGVGLSHQLVRNGLLVDTDGDFRVTDVGAEVLTGFGLDLDVLSAQERPFSRACMDWSEQDHHLAGSLGAGLCNELFRLGWVEGREASRVVLVTDAGRAGMFELFGYDADASAPTALAA